MVVRSELRPDILLATIIDFPGLLRMQVVYSNHLAATSQPLSGNYLFVCYSLSWYFSEDNNTRVLFERALTSGQLNSEKSM